MGRQNGGGAGGAAGKAAATAAGRTDRPAPGRAESRPPAGSGEYDRFWRCQSGARATEAWPGADASPLANLRHAFGLAEERRPIPQPGGEPAAPAPAGGPSRRR